MLRCTVSFFCALMCLGALECEAQSTPVPKFEAASIRACDPSARAGLQRSENTNPTPGSLTISCVTLKDLIETAYHFSVDRPEDSHTVLQVPIEGGPDWVYSKRFTINARAAGDPGPNIIRGPMLQKLLEERFNLKVRRISREVKVYALTIAKGGPKLQPFQAGTCIDLKPGPPDPEQKPLCGAGRSKRNGAVRTYEFFKMTVEEFAQNLGVNSGPRLLDRPVIDKTGLAGLFNFTLTYEPETAAAPDEPSTGPSIFTAVQEQLGLKLEPAKGPADFLVIDSVDRPSEN